MDPETREQLKTVFRRLEAVEHKLDGNGRPGLIERLAALEKSITITNRLLLCVFGTCVGTLVKVFAG